MCFSIASVSSLSADLGILLAGRESFAIGTFFAPATGVGCRIFLFLLCPMIISETAVVFRHCAVLDDSIAPLTLLEFSARIKPRAFMMS